MQPNEVIKASQFKEKDVLLALNTFLNVINYDYSLIPTGASKTPEVFILGCGEKYICEFKSPLLKFDHKERPFGYKFKTNHRKMLEFIHTAKKQFYEYDPEHKFPHILIYTSAHFQLYWKNFLDAVEGGIKIPERKKLQPDLRNTKIHQSSINLIPSIDGYIWLQIGDSKQFYQSSYFLNHSSLYRNTT